MSNINEEYSFERTFEKFQEATDKLAKRVGAFVKKSLEAKFADDIEMSIECYTKNAAVFSLAPNRTIFSTDFGEKHNYSMPKSKNIDYVENLTNIISWARKKGILEEYLENVRKNCDYTIYIKFLESAESPRFNKMVLNDYKIDLKNKDNQKFFKYIRTKIRNTIAHANNSAFEEYKQHNTMQEDADKLLKFAKMFLTPETNKAEMSHIQEAYEAVMEVINSKPISLEEILKNYPAFENENNVINVFNIDYDKESQYLYANSLKMIEKEANQISPSSENVHEEKEEKARVSTIKKERISVANKNIVKDEIKSLLSYKDQVTLNVINEIGLKANILIDGEVFEGSKLLKDDGENNRNYLYENVLKPLERIKRYAIINYSSRIALNRKYYKTSNEEEKHKVKQARDAIHYFVERDGLRYSPSCGIVYKTGIYETIRTIEENPEKRFFVVVNSAKDANLIEDNCFDNVLVARIIGFGNDKQLRLTNNSLSKVDSFAKYDFLDFNDDNDNDEETLEEEIGTEKKAGIIEDISINHTEKDVVVSKNKDKDKNKDEAKDKSKDKEKASPQPAIKNSKQKSNKLPAIASVPCIPDNNEMIKVDVLPKEGGKLLTSANNTITLGKTLGEGGEGTVYEVNDDLVAKIYHKNRLTKNRFDKLNLMIKCGFNSERICFPLELLFNASNQFVGYTMKKASSDYMNLGESILQLNNKNALEKFTDLKKWDRHALTSFCAKLADIFVKLHENNILMGDINANNILVDIKDTSGASLLIVDTDSFQIGPYPCPVGTPVFTSPEIYKRTNKKYPRYGNFLRTLKDEQYALASLLFQVLFLGQTPFAGKGVVGEGIEALKNYNFDYRSENSSGADVPDGPFRMIWQNIGFKLKEMFKDTFTGEKTYSAKEWKNALEAHAKNIKDGKADNNLKPYRYPSLPYMKDFVCDKCKRQANLPEDQYERKVMYKELLLCKECDQEWLRTVKETITDATCSTCQKSFKASAYNILRQQMKGYLLKCSDCEGEVSTKCCKCGKSITVPRYKYNNPKFNKRFRCDECLTNLNIYRAIEDSGYYFDERKKIEIRKKILEKRKELEKRLKRKLSGEEFDEITEDTISIFNNEKNGWYSNYDDYKDYDEDEDDEDEYDYDEDEDDEDEYDE